MGRCHPSKGEHMKEALKLALEALEGIQRYGLDTLSGRVDGPDDREWQRAGVNEMTKRARLGITAIKEALAQPEERNFCPRCGKRTADPTTIHTCTPPT